MRTIGSLIVLACMSAACASTPPQVATYGLTSSAPPQTSATSQDAKPATVVAAAEVPVAAAPAAEPSAPAASAAPTDEDLWRDTFHNVPSNDVLRAMRATQGKVQSCVHESQKRDPGASGEVKIKFIVTEEGKVLSWKDDGSSMSDEDLTHCLGEVVNTVKFPAQKPSGNSVGLYTLMLSN